MTTDEELLTGALNRTASRLVAHDLRPLAEPGPAERTRPAWRGRRGPRRWGGWLAPTAAAAAVVVIVAIALVVSGITRQPGTAAVRSPAAGTAALPAGLPKYYAEVEGKFVGWHGPNAVEVVVRDTSTGATVARIPAPYIAQAPKALPLSVAAAPDDRTFYALYGDWGRTDSDFWIYRFGITPSGHATGLTAVSGGVITGQRDVGNVGGFAVSPDGTQLALAVAASQNGTYQSTVAGEIVVVDLQTGTHSVWQGGMNRPRQVFGIQSLSWSGNGQSVVYEGQWCPDGDFSYGVYGGFTCSVGGSVTTSARPDGDLVVRDVSVAAGGGSLASGPVLLEPSTVAGEQPVVADPSGTDLITLRSLHSDSLSVVKVAPGTGQVVSVLGTLPSDYSLGNTYLSVSPSGRYTLAWMAGLPDGMQGNHGWVGDGDYYQLAPSFPPNYPGGWYQMTW